MPNTLGKIMTVRRYFLRKNVFLHPKYLISQTDKRNSQKIIKLVG